MKMTTLMFKQVRKVNNDVLGYIIDHHLFTKYVVRGFINIVLALGAQIEEKRKTD